MYSRTTSRHPSQWMNSPGNSSSSHKGRLFFWFRRGRDPPKKPTHPRPRRRAPLDPVRVVSYPPGARPSHRTLDTDIGPAAHWPVGPAGAMIDPGAWRRLSVRSAAWRGRRMAQDPKLARALARLHSVRGYPPELDVPVDRFIRRRAADKAVVSRVPADELQPSIHGRRAS